jgi:transposase
MDNVPFHKVKIVIKYILLVGYEYLFLPSYFHFLNPIEKMFSTLKDKVKRSKPSNENEFLSSITTTLQQIEVIS